MSWIRRIIACALLAVSPLSGVRVVCVIDAPPTDAQLRSERDLGCQTVCSKRPPATSHTRCALVEDVTCAYALGSTAAVLPDEPSLPFALTAEPCEPVYRTADARPARDPAFPPPKA
jgi:hypothetical protein